MYDVHITRLYIERVRNLKDVDISLEHSDGKRRHLIITGRNGSGKTSLLEALSKHLDWLVTHGDPQKQVDVTLNVALDGLMSHFQKGEFILAYYRDNRVFEAEQPKHVEKVELKETYSINVQSARAAPRYEFIKYLLDMKVTEALAARSQDSGRQKRAERIRAWFNEFDSLLQRIFNDCVEDNGRGKKDVRLAFDEETYQFTIHEADKEPFDFNSLSAGFAAVLDVVVDLIMRMEKHTGEVFRFDLPGIVLIDEIETHLHLELQRMILPFLTTFFPNIQFVVSTHSPFILNSLKDVVIYDLENRTLVDQPQGLTDVPFNGIVEGYFNTDKLSAALREKYERFREIVTKKNITDGDIDEIARLEMFLDEIPDYLALDIATEYKRLKSEFESREDL